MRNKIVIIFFCGLVMIFDSCHFVRRKASSVLHLFFHKGPSTKYNYDDYLPHEPDCIPGVYYNRCNATDTIYVLIKPDHTFFHHVRVGKNVYNNEGRWGYEGLDNSPHINLTNWKSYVEEGGTGDKEASEWHMGLEGCTGIIFGDDDDQNFYKK